MKSIEEIEFTIFDTETTGLNPKTGDRIVELAGLRFKGKDKIATFQMLVNPGRPISEAAFAVNKISQGMLENAPSIEKIIPEFLNFIQGSCLCSYNAGFDLEFISNEFELNNQKFPQDILVIDILKMARRLLPGLERYALWFVAEKLGCKRKQEHRAFSDVEITLDVFNKLKGILTAKGIYDFANFAHLFSISTHLLESANNQKIAQIQEAIDLGVKLKIRYLSVSGAEVSEREVIPKEIKQDKSHIYLVGYCCLREEERTFRIDGILHLEIV